MGLDISNLRPGNADVPVASGPGSYSSQKACSTAPDGGAAEDRHDLSRLTRPAFNGEIIDFAATTALAVEQLVVENAKREIELFAHDCPTLVRTISGIAENETARMIRK